MPSSSSSAGSSPKSTDTSLGTDRGGHRRVPGMLAFGRYQLDRLLGRGVTGVAVLAWDTKERRRVTLRFLPEIVIGNGSVLESLRRESVRVAALMHPAVARLFGLEEDQDSAAVCTEFIEGHSLADSLLVRPGRIFEAVDLMRRAEDLCNAVQAAHDQGLVHGDIKPSNLIETREGEMKMIDFAIRACLSPALGESALRSSFASPHVNSGGQPGPADDVYSIGATIYYLLTGTAPYEGTEGLITMTEQRRRRGLTGAGEIPVAWEEAVAACLDRDATRRPSSPAEVVRRLDKPASRGVAVAPVATPPPPIPPLPTSRSAQPSNGPAATGASSGIAVNPGSRHKLEVYRRPAPGSSAASTSSTTTTGWSETDASGKTHRGSRIVKILALTVLLLGMAAGAGALYQRLASKAGELRLRSEPSGAMIILAGVGQMTSPAVFRHLKPGSYSVRIEMPGYDTAARTIQLEKGQTLDVGVIALEPALGLLRVTSSPDGSEVKIRPADSPALALSESDLSGTTPHSARLPAGRYVIQVRRADWEQQQLIDVGAHQEVESRFDFPYGAVELTSQPAGAQVFREGNPIGVTPLTVTNLRPGTAEFQIKTSGLEQTRKVDVQPGRSVAADVVFQMPPPPPPGPPNIAGTYQGSYTYGPAYGSLAGYRVPLTITIQQTAGSDRFVGLMKEPYTTFGTPRNNLLWADLSGVCERSQDGIQLRMQKTYKYFDQEAVLYIGKYVPESSSFVGQFYFASRPAQKGTFEIHAITPR